MERVPMCRVKNPLIMDAMPCASICRIRPAKAAIDRKPDAHNRIPTVFGNPDSKKSLYPTRSAASPKQAYPNWYRK